MTFAGLLAVAFTSACGTEPPPPRTTPVEVMAPEQWQAIPRSEDPFVVEFPEAVTECLSDGVDTSEGLLDVDTGTCGFVTAQNVLIDEIRASEQVRLTFWHLALTAPEPAEGRLVLRVGDDTLFDVTVEIPAKEKVYYPAVIAPRRYAPGTPVVVHVHNHGANTWKIYQLMSGG